MGQYCYFHFPQTQQVAANVDHREISLRTEANFSILILLSAIVVQKVLGRALGPLVFAPKASLLNWSLLLLFIMAIGVAWYTLLQGRRARFVLATIVGAVLSIAGSAQLSLSHTAGSQSRYSVSPLISWPASSILEFVFIFVLIAYLRRPPEQSIKPRSVVMAIGAHFLVFSVFWIAVLIATSAAPAIAGAFLLFLVLDALVGITCLTANRLAIYLSWLRLVIMGIGAVARGQQAAASSSVIFYAAVSILLVTLLRKVLGATGPSRGSRLAEATSRVSMEREPTSEHTRPEIDEPQKGEWGSVRSYKCDICSAVMPSKESGFQFDRNRVLASPSYWEHFFRVAKDPIMSQIFTEDAKGAAIRSLLKSDTGYVICASCKDMLQKDPEKAREYRLDPWFSSMQARDFQAADRAQAKESLQAVLITIGTVYERTTGKWPSFVSMDEFEARARRWAGGGNASSGRPALDGGKVSTSTTQVSPGTTIIDFSPAQGPPPESKTLIDIERRLLAERSFAERTARDDGFNLLPTWRSLSDLDRREAVKYAQNVLAGRISRAPGKPESRPNEPIPVRHLPRIGDSYVDRCFDCDWSELDEPRNWKSEPGLGSIRDLYENGHTDAALAQLAEAWSFYSDYDFVYIWKAKLLMNKPAAVKVLTEGMSKCRQKFYLCRELGDLEYHAKKNLGDAVAWWIRSAVAQLSTRGPELDAPFLYLAYIAGALGDHASQAQLFTIVDRLTQWGRLNESAANHINSLVAAQGSRSMAVAIRRLCEEFLNGAPAPQEVDERRSPPSPGAENYRRSIEFARRGDWKHATDEVHTAWKYGHQGACSALNTMWCPRCRTRISQPSTVAMSDYARFWRGACPRCETQLRFSIQ
jgi:hypothetical protein